LVIIANQFEAGINRIKLLDSRDAFSPPEHGGYGDLALFGDFIQGQAHALHQNFDGFGPGNGLLFWFHGLVWGLVIGVISIISRFKQASSASS
jgi:hypothetical protein